MSEWQSKELSPQEFTICIVTLNLQKRKKPKTERFAAQRCYAKLFQVSVSGSTHTAFFSSANDSEERNSQFEGCKRQSENRRDSGHASIASGCPPASLKRVGVLPSQPARGAPRDPLAYWQKKNMSELITQQF